MEPPRLDSTQPTFINSQTSAQVAPYNGSALADRVFVPPPPAMPRQRVRLHLGLYLLTVASTIYVGKILFGSYSAGALFSFGLLAILTAHEFGHYFTLHYYGVPASLPYFIPMPFSPFGTFGAVIRMSPEIPHRRALFDIAAAGPLAGIILAIPLTYIGIVESSVAASNPDDALFVISAPFLFRGLKWLALGSSASGLGLALHPLAYAGWAGMFVTALNLMPVGQLDGGHVSYALFGSRGRLIARAMFFGLGLYSIVTHNAQWVILLMLLLLMGIQHPRTRDDGYALGPTRQMIGALLALIFVSCFSLVPFVQ
ncbi:MAG: site-2 protease family protein [Acidobacteria bacterium]|nr:site-2 protease family protein [Acidobacteriota bacterium]